MLSGSSRYASLATAAALGFVMHAPRLGDNTNLAQVTRGVGAMDRSARLGRLRAAMEEEDLDAAAMVPGPNLYFLTGAHFHLMERPTVLFVPREGPLHAVILSLLRGVRLIT